MPPDLAFEQVRRTAIRETRGADPIERCVLLVGNQVPSFAGYGSVDAQVAERTLLFPVNLRISAIIAVGYGDASDQAPARLSPQCSLAIVLRGKTRRIATGAQGGAGC